MSTCASTASRNTSEHMWSPCTDASHPKTPQRESFTFMTGFMCLTDNFIRTPAVKRLNVTDCKFTDVLKYPVQLIPFSLIKRALKDVISKKRQIRLFVATVFRSAARARRGEERRCSARRTEPSQLTWKLVLLDKFPFCAVFLTVCISLLIFVKLFYAKLWKAL